MSDINVGSLFVSIGIKGSDKTIGAIGATTKGLKETASMGLEAKAAIVGAMYALERLTAASGAYGTGLTNFNALTGDSVQVLQKWQYAARQAGVSGEEMAGTFKTVQSTMANMLLGKGAPEGLAMVANKVGFDQTQARDRAYVLGQLQKFAQSVPADVGNWAIRSFGVGDNMIAAMRRNAFNPAAFARAPTYSDKEISALDRANIAWSNLGQHIEMAVGHFNAKHGGELVRDITKITDAVLKLVVAVTQLAEKMKVFEGLSKLLNFAADAVESKPGTLLGEKHIESKTFDSLIDLLKLLFVPRKGTDPDYTGGPVKPIWDASYAAPGGPRPASGQNQTISVQQTLQFQHDGKDAKKTGDSVHKAVRDAYRQMSAQAQGS